MENELSCSNYGLMMELSTEQLTNCYFHNNWENSNDQNDPFESAYSSMVSSPSTTPIPSSSNGGEDGMMIRELIGRLGSICDSSGTENNGDSREASSVTGQNPSIELEGKSQKSANSRKRKSISKDKFKDNTCTPSITDDKGEGKIEESDAKRSKVENEENKKENKEESNTIACVEKQNNNNNNNDDNNNDNDRKEAQKLEPPKDYIHVRARRGQATDSHSLAERVRREKISERMKFLQDLVPGCNKVTGKATVLDEIINYVQSLQRQVEFLSMKLSTVNSGIEFNMEALLSKDLFQSRGSSLPQTVYPSDQNSAEGFHFGYQSTREMSLAFSNGDSNQSSYSVNHMNLAGIRRNPSVPLPSVDGFVDYMSQLPTLWEDDLQSIVQMGIFPNQTQGVSGTLPNAP